MSRSEVRFRSATAKARLSRRNFVDPDAAQPGIVVRIDKALSRKQNRSFMLKSFLAVLLAIGLGIGFGWLITTGRYVDPATVSIEATELWFNPWPPPGDRN